MRRKRTKSRPIATTPIEAAFFAIRSQLARYVARLVTNAMDVEDILQETYLKARRGEENGHVRNPRGYLFAVARSVALNDLARKSRSIVEYIDDAAALEVESNEPSVEEQIASHQRFEVFCDAVATLPAQCRRAFVLRKVFGYSQKEIAKEMGISESTVEKHLIKGLQRCRAYMRESEAEWIQDPSISGSRKSKTECE